MKKLLFFLGFIAGSVSLVQAQNVYIPDANFKNALLNQPFGYIIDTGGDGEISYAEAAVVTSLTIEHSDIADLTGIEAFTALQFLECISNNLTTVNLTQNTDLRVLKMHTPLTSLDITQNTMLNSLIASGLFLETLNLSQNPLLMSVDISGNDLTVLDLGYNINLIELYVSGNSLYHLNLKNGNNSNLIVLHTQGNSDLRCIEVDNPVWSTANWTGPDFWFDSDVVFATDCSNITYVPDDNFEAHLEANGMGDGIPNNNYVLTSNINDYHVFDIQGLGIQDLTGIEDFINLHYLNCSNNLISSIDLSQNQNLTELYCSNNQLTYLNLDFITHLYALDCSHNLLTNLDVSNNPNLTFLRFSYNALTEIDLTQHIYPLVTLEADHNRLEGVLDISNCPNLQIFDASGQDANCPTCFNPGELEWVDLKNGNNEAFTHINLGDMESLKCVQVDNVAWSQANWTGSNFNFGSEVVFSENCSNVMSTTDLDLNRIGMYPNPVNDILYFSEDVSNLRLMDLSGKTVKQVSIKLNSINVSELPKGVYVVIAESKSGDKISKKLIKN